MEGRATMEPDTVEVLPQHRFDVASLETYLHRHLPGFGAEPGASLTIVQYRYPAPAAEGGCAPCSLPLGTGLGGQGVPGPRGCARTRRVAAAWARCCNRYNFFSEKL